MQSRGQQEFLPRAGARLGANEIAKVGPDARAFVPFSSASGTPT
jgi:hypothetical protein